MPPQTAKPIKSLKARYGDRLRKAHEATKDAPVELRAGDLPGGITNGIAKLSKMYFAEYKQGDLTGQPYCMGVGICVFPKEHAGGRTTFGPEPMCDTPKYSQDQTFEDHVRNVENVFKALGADMSNTDADDAMEATAKALEESGVYFRFTTNTGKKNEQTGETRVWHNWGAACDYTPDGEAATDPNYVGDDSPADDEPEPVSPPPPPAKPAAKSVAKGPAVKKPPVKPDLSESTDLDALLAAANDAATDEEYASVASARLTALAVEAGHDEETVNAAESWDAVVELVNNPPTADEEPAADEPTGWNKDDLCEYRPVDPKTKKPGKAVLCEITKVDDAGETVDLRSTVNKKQTWAKIPFAKIEVAS